MARVALPRIPESGRDLEDYVAGLFQAAGYFVEKNLRQRDVSEVLELDAVATSYDGPMPISVLAEAKGGRWGFPDIFKVAGWMQYLGIARGGVFVKDHASAPARDVARMHRKVAPLGVSLIDLGDFSEPEERFREAGFRGLIDPLLIEVWRLSFAVERTLMDDVRRERRAAPERGGPTELLAYHDLVNDHAFFLKNVPERLGRLYDAYKTHPKLSARIAAEIDGEPFVSGRAPAGHRGGRVLAEAMYEAKHPSVQASFYLEHRARIAIVKAAIDLCCLAAGGFDDDGAREAISALPATFREGLRKLRERRSFRRFALLWQVFLWGYGGFYLADREDEEFGWLAAQTGIPRSEIGEGLAAFDDLFPLGEGTWIVPLKNTSIRLVKLVPAVFRGVGAVQRLRRHGAANYDGFGGGAMGRRNLISWHNALIRLLARQGESANR